MSYTDEKKAKALRLIKKYGKQYTSDHMHIPYRTLIRWEQAAEAEAAATVAAESAELAARRAESEKPDQEPDQDSTAAEPEHLDSSASPIPASTIDPPRRRGRPRKPDPEPPRPLPALVQPRASRPSPVPSSAPPPSPAGRPPMRLVQPTMAPTQPTAPTPSEATPAPPSRPASSAPPGCCPRCREHLRPSEVAELARHYAAEQVLPGIYLGEGAELEDVGLVYRIAGVVDLGASQQGKGRPGMSRGSGGAREVPGRNNTRAVALARREEEHA